MIQNIIVRKCQTLEEFHGCVDLQREIWGEKDLEVEPATIFVVAAHTGGQVLGAFDGNRLIGYTLALVGLRNGKPFLHSHMTGVHADYRDRGVASTRRSSEPWHSPHSMDLRSARASQCALQLEPPRRDLPRISS